MTNAVNTIGSGTTAGAVQYLDFLSSKGHLTHGSVRALKTGFTRVAKTLGGEEWEKIEVRSIDVDDYMTRFANMTQGQYNVASLADYKSRVTKVVTWYLEFLSKPGWVPDVKARTLSKAPMEKTPIAAKTEKQNDHLPSAEQLTSKTETSKKPAALSNLVAFPFPLTDGTLASLYLPPSISNSDAKRMARFIETLVIEEGDNE